MTTIVQLGYDQSDSAVASYIVASEDGISAMLGQNVRGNLLDLKMDQHTKARIIKLLMPKEEVWDSRPIKSFLINHLISTLNELLINTKNKSWYAKDVAMVIRMSASILSQHTHEQESLDHKE